ncbi:MAG: hypothetical protein QW687_02295 [Candidatus Hadarchaeales archaeon]
MEVSMEMKGQSTLLFALLISIFGLMIIGLILDGSLVLRYYIILRNACSLSAQTAAGQAVDVPYYMRYSEVILDPSLARTIAYESFNMNRISSMKLVGVRVSPEGRWVEVEGEGEVVPVMLKWVIPSIKVRVKARAYGAYGIRQEGE